MQKARVTWKFIVEQLKSSHITLLHTHTRFLQIYWLIAMWFINFTAFVTTTAFSFACLHSGVYMCDFMKFYETLCHVAEQGKNERQKINQFLMSMMCANDFEFFSLPTHTHVIRNEYELWRGEKVSFAGMLEIFYQNADIKRIKRLKIKANFSFLCFVHPSLKCL